MKDRGPKLDGLDERLLAVLESAARLQAAVPDAVLVGGSAAAMYAGHRASFDHDHVLADLKDRYEIVLEAVEATQGWATSVRASRPPMTLMGSLGGIEAGLRQLRRSTPLQVQTVMLPSGHTLVAPTPQEALRVKGYLVVQRNQVRDYLDVVALSDLLGLAGSVAALEAIDRCYVDRSGEEDSVLTELVTRLSRPEPRDQAVIAELSAYKGLRPRWQEWRAVVAACHQLADGLLGVA